MTLFNNASEIYAEKMTYLLRGPLKILTGKFAQCGQCLILMFNAHYIKCVVTKLILVVDANVSLSN